jgi:hypothetical protein
LDRKREGEGEGDVKVVREEGRETYGISSGSILRSGWKRRKAERGICETVFMRSVCRDSMCASSLRPFTMSTSLLPTSVRIQGRIYAYFVVSRNIRTFLFP